ncbi:MAG: radical SAM protein [Candidatus Sericytochromatia bacterium]
MRITFLILKDYRHQHNQSSGPIGLAYLSAAAKARYPDAHVQIEVDVDRVIASKPDIIGVSAYTETYSQSINAAHYLRNRLPGIPLWLGGPHVNALPTTLAREFDLGVVGEGEETFVELLALYRNDRLIPDELAKINGVVYWDEGQRKVTPPREVIQELDRIILPDRSVMQTYWPPTQSMIQWPQPIYTSRGCPFKCVFCIFSLDTQKVRYHSVERVVAEIEDILRHYPDHEHITIHDDLFALSTKRLAALTAGIREAGLHKKVSFICMAKASVFSDEMARLMRDMNVSIVTFGLESGVERTLKYLKGERNKVADNVRAIDICARHGIRMGGYFIIGTPHETHAELQEAYWFIRHHFPPMSMAGIYRLTPFPGTKFWQEAIDLGIVSNELEDWRPFNYLDQDKRDFLFFNQHYSLDTFKEAYPHFAKITDRNYLAISTERQELALKAQIEPLYADWLQRFPAQRILEFSGFTRMLAQWSAEEAGLQTPVDLLRPWELADFETSERYDLILCNLALEQCQQTPAEVLERLQSWLAPGGRLVLITYNPAHHSLLGQLLSGRWNSDFWGSRPFDLRHFAAPEQVARLLGPALPVAETHALDMPGPRPGVPDAALEILAQIHGASLTGLDTIAYTVVTHPLQEQHHGRHLQTTRESGPLRDLARP